MRSYSHSSASRSPFTCFAMSARGSAAVATGRRATIMRAICAMVPTNMSRDGAVPRKKIVVSLLKGGVGRTFIATHLAWYLAEHGGNRVALDQETTVEGEVGEIRIY